MITPENPTAGHSEQSGTGSNPAAPERLVYEFDGWSYEKLEAQRGRAHFLLAAPYRYVSVILVPASSSSSRGERGNAGQGRQRRLICMDSPCYHAAGPLGEGDLVELEDLCGKANKTKGGDGGASSTVGGSMLCIRCPWHRYLVSLETGEEVLLYPTADSHNNNNNSSSSTVYTQQQLPPSTHRISTLSRGGAERDMSASRGPPVMFSDGVVAHVRMGKRVQRLHEVELDEETGVLKITVLDVTSPSAAEADNEQAKRDVVNPRRGAQVGRHRLLKSDGPATSLKNGGLCMQIQDIKAKGLDQL